MVGRSPACFLLLDVEYASKEHAVIQWTEGRWSLKDLGSRNGTFLEGRRVEPGILHRLIPGQRIAFGRAEDPWILEDDRPPEALALNLSSRRIRESAGGLIALPDDDSPEVVVLQRPDGYWTMESADGDDARTVQDRQTVSVGDESWCLLLPEPQEATPLLPTSLGIESVIFRFGVSQDEERVTLTLVAPHRSVPVQAREFNYVLLTLARARLADRDQPLPERGWIDRESLLRMLRMRPTAL
ncbi:MAG: FHA domain-containing protein, partial [Myxococcota bacterium]